MIFPLVVTNALYTQFAVNTMIYVGAVAAWNLFSGYSGYIALGNAVFFGTGAYTVGLLANHWKLPGGDIFALLPLGGLVAALVAVPLGLIALRVRRHTFVVITIAFFFIFQLMAFNLSFTGGNQGVSSPFFLWSASDYNNPFYYVGLIIAVGTITLSWLIRNSRVRPPAAGHPGRRGPGPRAGRADHEDQAHRVRDLGRDRRHDRRPVVVLHRAGAARDRVQSAVRPDRRADGLPGRVRHAGRPGARRADPGAAPADRWITFTNGYTSDIVLGVLFLAVILFLPRGIVPTGAEFVTRWRAIRSGGASPPGRTAPGGSAPPGSPP